MYRRQRCTCHGWLAVSCEEQCECAQSDWKVVLDALSFSNKNKQFILSHYKQVIQRFYYYSTKFQHFLRTPPSAANITVLLPIPFLCLVFCITHNLCFLQDFNGITVLCSRSANQTAAGYSWEDLGCSWQHRLSACYSALSTGSPYSHWTPSGQLLSPVCPHHCSFPSAHSSVVGHQPVQACYSTGKITFTKYLSNTRITNLAILCWTV